MQQVNDNASNKKFRTVSANPISWKPYEDQIKNMPIVLSYLLREGRARTFTDIIRTALDKYFKEIFEEIELEKRKS